MEALKLESYLSTIEHNSLQSFVLVVQQEGAGRFYLKRPDRQDQPGYVVHSGSEAKGKGISQIIDSLPATLLELFNLGVIKIIYHHGDLRIELPVDLGSSFSKDELQQLARKACEGMNQLAPRYAVVEESEDLEVGNLVMSPTYLCIFVVLAILLAVYSYGSRVLAVNWLELLPYSVGFSALVFLLSADFARRSWQVGKLFTISFIFCSGIFLLIALGIFNFESKPNKVELREGIVEAIFTDGRIAPAIKIRLAMLPNQTFFIPRRLLNATPQLLPAAARFEVRKGFLGSLYIDSAQLID